MVNRTPEPSSSGGATSSHIKPSPKSTEALHMVSGAPHTAVLPATGVKARGSPKPKKRTRPPKASFKQYLFWPLILAFIYFAVVCPSKPESNLCIHSGIYWNTLKTHATPPIQYVTSHPLISPYVQKIEPTYRRVTRYAFPMLDKFTSITGAIIVRVETVLDKRFGKYIRPYVHKALLQFNARVQYCVEYARPYIDQGHRLVMRTWPYFERTKFALQQSWYNAQLYFRYVRLYVARGWITVRPHLILLLEKMNEVPAWMKRRLDPALYQAYRTYVEPQIRKILAKVDELSNSNSRETSSAATLSVKAASSPLSPPVEVRKTYHLDDISETERTVSSSIESTPTEIPVPITSDVADVTLSTKNPVEHTPHSTLSPASSVFSTQVSPAEREPEAESGSGLDTIIEDTLKEPTIPTATQLPVEDEATSAPTSTVQNPTTEEVLEKRKKIEERQAAWEAKVDEIGKAGVENVIFSTTHIRQKALDDLSSTEDGSIATQIATFEAEGARALKGVEGYANKLMKGDYNGAEKIGLFDAVVKKVEKRYGEGASKLSGVIAQWWAGVRDEVQKEARKESGRVVDMAGNAQADLGVDYARLEGVTIHDWTRYHDLKRTAAKYENQYEAIVGGEHAQSPVDPLPEAIGKLQEDLLEIVSSFEANLIKARDDGFGMFVSRSSKDTTLEGEPYTQLPSPTVSSGAAGESEQEHVEL